MDDPRVTYWLGQARMWEMKATEAKAKGIVKAYELAQSKAEYALSEALAQEKHRRHG